MKENINYLSENITFPIEGHSDVLLKNLTKTESFRSGNIMKNFTNEMAVKDDDLIELPKNVEEYMDGTMVTPMVLLSLMLFLYNMGLGSVPYVLISELFSINVSVFPIALGTDDWTGFATRPLVASGDGWQLLF